MQLTVSITENLFNRAVSIPLYFRTVFQIVGKVDFLDTTTGTVPENPGPASEAQFIIALSFPLSVGVPGPIEPVPVGYFVTVRISRLVLFPELTVEISNL